MADRVFASIFGSVMLIALLVIFASNSFNPWGCYTKTGKIVSYLIQFILILFAIFTILSGILGF